MDYLNLVLVTMLLGFVVFTLYQSIQKHKVCRENRSKFLEKHQNVREFNFTKKWNVFFVLLGAASLVMAAVSQPEEDVILFKLLFVWIAIMSISYVLENDMRRKLYVIDDGFLYDVNYYRFRSVDKCENKRSNSSMHLFDGDDVNLPKIIANQVELEKESWKQRKKDKKQNK
jgi:uncharacterized membrane protein